VKYINYYCSLDCSYLWAKLLLILLIELMCCWYNNVLYLKIVGATTV